MRQEVRIAPSHSLVLIMGEESGVIPATMAGGLVAATSTCVAVGTLSEHDGETHIVLTDGPDVANGGGSLAFDGVIAVRADRLGVCTVGGEVLLSLSTQGPSVRVRVYANDDAEPDVLIIVVTPPQP